MARVVIASWGSYGDVYPYIGLARELRRRGHRPVVAMPALYRTFAEQAEVEFHAIPPDIDIHDRAFAARVMDPKRGPEVIFGEAIAPHLPAVHATLMRASEGADTIITHPATPAAVIVAEERRLPWISTVLAPMSFFSIFDPVTPPPAPWMHDVLARSPTLSRAALWLMDRITRKWAEPIQAFRESRGLPRSAENPILAGQHSPHLVLAMFSSVLSSPQPDWPPHVCVTGAMMYNGDPGASLTPELLTFLGSGPPPIVFTLGTSAVAAAGSFYDVSAAAIHQLGLRAVLLAGPYAQNRPSTSSKDILLAEFAPHAALFSRAAAIVHQGGIGTLHQALASGKPMLVVPHSHDQPDNAQRAKQLGVALTLAPRRYTVATVERALRTLMNPGYAERAAAVGARVRVENGPARAADAIERLVH